MGRGRERSKGREKKRFPIGELVMHLLLLLLLFFLRGHLIYYLAVVTSKTNKQRK